jgi:transcriptional regulator of acetoin/glycerol metabolism
LLAAASKNRTQPLIDGLSHVDCIDLVVRKGTLISGVWEIATSWRRLLTAHRLDSNIQAAPHITAKEM